MEKQMARIDRLYHVMVELLNAPKTIDVMRKMPAYVEDGEVYDFNGRSFGGTDKPDGPIFKQIERVKTTQAVTAALKRDYTNALGEWLNDDKGAEEDAVEKPKKKSKDDKATKEPSEADAAQPTTEEGEELDLVAAVTGLLDAGKLKKAKKMIKDNEDHPKIKKAKKLYKKAVAE